MEDRDPFPDDDAFEQAIRTHGPRLLASLRRLVGSEEEAREAFQDGMLCAWRARQSFRGRASLTTWLHRIVMNSALKRLRSRARDPQLDVDALLPGFAPEGYFQEPVAHWDEEDPQERAELRALVRAQIDRLPVDYRAVILLKDIEGHPLKHVAETLDISVGNAKIRIHRARQALRALLDPHMRRAARTP